MTRSGATQGVFRWFGSGPALAFLVFLPLFTVALLGVWYVEAKRVADGERFRMSQNQRAQQSARTVSDAVQAAVFQRVLLAEAQLSAGDMARVRDFYMSDPLLEMVAVYAPDDTLLFPKIQEMRIFAEDTILRRDALSLLNARQLARDHDLGWVGTLRNPRASVVGCKQGAVRVICLVLNREELFKIAETALPVGRILDFSAPEPTGPGVHRALALMPDPLGGLGVAIEARAPSGSKWPQVLAILLPTLMASLIAAYALISAQRHRLGAAEHRANVLAEISHDLRTPLANLRLYAKLLRSPCQTPQKTVQHAKVIEAETTRLSWAVDNALDVSQPSAAPGARMQQVVPGDVVQSLIERYAPLLQGMGAYHLNVSADQPVWMDTTTLERVLMNLLDNARKHAAGSDVRIACWQTGSMLFLRLEDEGPQKPGPGDGLHGFGLGLRACQTLAQASNGTFDYALAVTGSWFLLSIPISTARPETVHL